MERLCTAFLGEFLFFVRYVRLGLLEHVERNGQSESLAGCRSS